MDLRDRVALITGAAGGLAAVIAGMLADAGTHVAVTHLGHRMKGSSYAIASRQKGERAFWFISIRLTQRRVTPRSRQQFKRSAVSTSSSTTQPGTMRYRFRIFTHLPQRSGIGRLTPIFVVPF